MLRCNDTRKASMDSLVAAARELFSERGYESTSMRAIVDRAGTSIGNAYFYFSNKQALLEAVVADILKPRWAYFDLVQHSLESNVEKLAVSIYLNTLPAMSGAVPEIRLYQGRPSHVLLDALIDAIAQRNLAWFNDVFPSLSNDELQLTIQAILGSGKNVVVAKLAGDITGDADTVSRQKIQRDLRGAGFSDQEIMAGDAAITRVRQRSDWPAELFDGPRIEAQPAAG